MKLHERVQQIIQSSIDTLNQENPPDAQIEKSDNTVLIGPSSKVDSLGLVSLFFTIETKCRKEFNVSFSLFEYKMISDPSQQFATMGQLCELVCTKLRESGVQE